MKRINLWDVEEFCGIIFPAKTGFVFTNQVGGTLCGHPELEGIFIPLDASLAPTELQHDIHDYAGPYDEALVRALLRKAGIDETFDTVAPEEVDALAATWSGGYGLSWRLAEAWVPVRVRKLTEFGDSRGSREKWPLLGEFSSMVGVLTWSNSD